MKKIRITIFVLICLAFISCKKNRECECSNANGVYFAGEIEATKSKAKKHCESLSTGATECYLK